MARSPEAIERRKEAARARYREQRKDPAYVEKTRNRMRAAYQSDPEKGRSKSRANYQKHAEEYNKKRAERRKRNQDETLKYQREYYARNQERLSRKIDAAKYRRDPTRGLYAAERDYRSGRITLDELIRLYDGAIARLNDRAREVGEEVELYSGGQCLQLCEEYQGADEVEARLLEVPNGGAEIKEG